MVFVRPLLLCLVLLGCEARRPEAPDWVRSAPAAAVAAVSFRADWAMEQPRLRALMDRYPLAGRSLDLFLTRARVSLSPATGRLTVYQFSSFQPGGTPGFLIQLTGFPDPGGLQVAIADAFALDGSQAMDNRGHSLFLVLDLAPARIQALVDGEGRVWLGDKATLAEWAGSALAGSALAGPAIAEPSLVDAVAWISSTAAVQGFIRPPGLLDDASGRRPGELAGLPPGIQCVAWSVSAASARDPFNPFELAMCGSGPAIQRVAPWLQRFLAAAGANPGGPAPAPEILQEATRIVLRCKFSPDQVDVALARLDQPPLPFH